MTIQVGPSPAQLWHALRAVLLAPVRFWRYLSAPVPCDAPASCPPLTGMPGAHYQEEVGLPPGYDPPSAALAAGLDYRDNWVYTPGGIITQKQAERLIGYANHQITSAVLADYGIWMTTEEQRHVTQPLAAQSAVRHARDPRCLP